MPCFEYTTRSDGLQQYNQNLGDPRALITLTYRSVGVGGTVNSVQTDNVNWSRGVSKYEEIKSHIESYTGNSIGCINVNDLGTTYNALNEALDLPGRVLTVQEMKALYQQEIAKIANWQPYQKNEMTQKLHQLNSRGVSGNNIVVNVDEIKASIDKQNTMTVPESATIGFNNVTENSVMVFWNPHSDGGSPITSYHLVLKNEDTGQTIIELNPNADTTNYFFQNLDSATNYKAYVMVINAIGNSFEQSNGFKTLGVTTPTYDFIIEPDGKVRMFRIGAVEYTEIKVNPDSVQSYIDRGVSRLLTASERAIPYPRPEPEPELKFCLNAYNIRESGSVYSTHYDSITAQKVEELQQTQLVIACDADYLPTEKQVQDFYGFTPLPPTVDTSINETMVSQSIGAFILKEGIVKGEILYIANEAKYDNENKLITGFNPFYYGKNLTSLVQIKSKSGVILVQKPNDLNFTETERDERIYIDENVQNYKELIIDFFVWDSAISGLRFATTKQIQVVEELPPPDPLDPKPPTTCGIGFHKDFSGKCVPDDPPGELPRDKLIDTIKGFLFGTVALSLLARKY